MILFFILDRTRKRKRYKELMRLTRSLLLGHQPTVKVQTSRLNQTLSPSTQKEPKRPRSSLGSSALSRSNLSRSTPQLVQTKQATPLRKISRPLNDDLNYKGKIKTAKSISNLSAKQRRKRLKPDDVRATRDETGITI